MQNVVKKTERLLNDNLPRRAYAYINRAWSVHMNCAMALAGRKRNAVKLVREHLEATYKMAKAANSAANVRVNRKED